MNSWPTTSELEIKSNNGTRSGRVANCSKILEELQVSAWPSDPADASGTVSSSFVVQSRRLGICPRLIGKKEVTTRVCGHSSWCFLLRIWIHVKRHHVMLYVQCQRSNTVGGVQLPCVTFYSDTAMIASRRRSSAQEQDHYW